MIEYNAVNIPHVCDDETMNSKVFYRKFPPLFQRMMIMVKNSIVWRFKFT